MLTETQGALGDALEETDANLSDLRKERDKIDAEIRELTAYRKQLEEKLI